MFEHVLYLVGIVVTMVYTKFKKSIALTFMKLKSHANVFEIDI
jgi:hypothetical protein